MYKLCTFSTFSTVSKSSQPCNFLPVHFFATFSTDSKSASNPAFFDTQIENILKKYVLGRISTFCKLLSQTRTKRRKKRKMYFQMCLRIHFVIHLWVRTLNFLKKSLNHCSLMYIVHVHTCKNHDYH